MTATLDRYWGGDGSSMGRVHALPSEDFPALVREFLGHPCVLDVTRQQFHALPKADRDKAKRTPYITPACFDRPRDAVRQYEHATHCNLVALDIDDPAQAGPYVKNPDLLRDALHPHPFAAYTTASSTEAAPRLRILVSAERLPLSEYARAVRHVASLLGMRTITKESSVAVQPMYLPAIFRGEDPMLFHPLIANALVGTALTVKHLTNGDGVTTTSPAPNGTGTVDDLDFLRPPVPGVTLQDAEEALTHLDPDMPMAGWIEVASALKHQFQDAAFSLWNSWSAKGKKYPTEEDLAYRWKTLRANTRNRLPVTIRTLFHRASIAGWNAKGTTARLFKELLAWLGNPERTDAELMTDGVKRIAALPLATPVERSAALSRLRLMLADRDVKVSARDLEKALRRLDRSIAKAITHDSDTKAVPDKELPTWARGLCYVAANNVFFHRASDRQFSPEVLDRVYGAFLMGGTDSDTGRPVVRPQDYLLNVARIPRVDHFLYDPRHPEQTFVREGEKRFVNLYLPTYPEPDADDADYAGEVFWTHLTHLIAEENYRKILVDYLAYLVQCPGEKVRWAVLIQGAEGCGKTAIATAMAGVLGHSNVRVIDAAMIFRDFNGWAMGAQLVAMEEIRVVGHNRYDVMNRLKPCITNDVISVEEKHEKAVFRVPNLTNYLMFTNHHDGLAVTKGDRRYFVVNSALQTKEQVLDLGYAYFPKLYDTILNHAPGLRAWLDRWDFTLDFDPQGHAPATTYLNELVDAVATPLMAAIKDIMDDGDHALVKPDCVSATALQTLLHNEGVNASGQQIATTLRDMGMVYHSRPRLEDGKHRVWVRRGAPLPDLKARAAGSGSPDFAELL